ncbi:hypothetical protein C7954_11936 [Halanaerobium congolense]|jgi:hypothetical protein|uniref:Dolichyl-phosphate-mannose-protein mannosyltransferase n=2 Tax=Halanaerobium congolense TaxID=54121 RepID=A0A4R8GCT6_9FIRM|nr:hypothetical protein C7954_11936 [Halanaerobium congolense]
MKKNLKYLLILLATILIGIILFQLEYINVIILMILIYTFFVYKYSKTKNKLYLFIIIAFTLRMIFIILDYSFELLPYGWDTGQFQSTALLIKNNLYNFRNLFYNISESTSVKSYSLFVSFIYTILGSYEINIRIINALLGVLIAREVYDISIYTDFNKEMALKAAFLSVFWPSFIIFTSINMRDALIIFLTLNLIKQFFKFKEHIILNKLIFLLDFIFIFYLRKQNLPLFIFIFIVYFIWKKVKNSALIYKIISILGLAFSFFGVLYLLEANIFPLLSFDYIAREMEYRTSGGAAYLEWISYNNIFDMIIYLPIRSLYFLFAPFIWDISSNIFIIFAFLESTMLIGIILYTLRNFVISDKIYNKRILLLLIFLAIGVLGYAVVTANFGTAIRHKMTFMILIFILISPYFNVISIVDD